jgi:hypothetical protein
MQCKWRRGALPAPHSACSHSRAVSHAAEHIGDEGCQAIAASLSRNAVLRTLSLHSESNLSISLSRCHLTLCWS